MTQHADAAAPFVILGASLSIAELNQWAALVLTLAGIAYTGRKLYLSFRHRKNGR